MRDSQRFFETESGGDLIDRPDGAEALGVAQPETLAGLGGQAGQRISRRRKRIFDGANNGGGKSGEHGQGFGFNFGAGAKGLTEQNGGVSLALLAFGSDSGDEHAYIVIATN
ncbi:MAG TPA: hypothetical protein VGR76_22070 [Candidatus Angelobacter sp.]|nr:hypothetical protein [Candidatus Angelobacter sp.]